MTKLQPMGTKIIVQTFVKEHEKTDGGIIAVDFELERGSIEEVGTDVAHLYKKGDIVLFPEGVGESIQYKKKACKWLDGRGLPNGSVWAVELEKKD